MKIKTVNNEYDVSKQRILKKLIKIGKWASKKRQRRQLNARQ